MAEVTIDLKISVSDLDRIEEIAESLKSVVKVATINYEDIGFGIKVIRAKVLVDDKGDVGFDVIEEKIKELDGVNEVDVMSMDRDSF